MIPTAENGMTLGNRTIRLPLGRGERLSLGKSPGQGLALGVQGAIALASVALAVGWPRDGQSQEFPATAPAIAAPDQTPIPTDPIADALAWGEQATALAQTARTPDQWDQVARAWLQALYALQQVPPQSPQRLFAQRLSRTYLEQLTAAQGQGNRASRPQVFPTLGSGVLDEQLGLYLSYVAVFGPPDVLLIGSSRVLQGIDPGVLQGAIAQHQGLPEVRVYSFGVNGATAQLVSFLLRQVLVPEQFPRLIVWAEGSRGFNSGRFDQTFAQVLDSPGFRAVQQGARPRFDWAGGGAVPVPTSGITSQGFLPVLTEFDPATYYRQFPRVPGQYDSSYQNFTLDGVQTLSLRAIAQFSREQNIPLVFVNLPLSQDFLDPVRLQYERQFQAYLQRESRLGGFVVVDLLEQWRGSNRFFADPSHINQAGAQQLARQLATLPAIPWHRLRP